MQIRRWRAQKYPLPLIGVGDVWQQGKQNNPLRIEYRDSHGVAPLIRPGPDRR